MSTPRPSHRAIVLPIALLLAACAGEVPDGGTIDGSEDTAAEPEATGDSWDPALVDQSASFVAASDLLLLVLEVRNDGEDEATVSAPSWDGDGGLTQTESGVLDWQLVTEGQQWTEDDLVDELTLAPDETAGLVLTFDVDCSVDPEGDAIAAITGPDGETAELRFSEAGELTDGAGPWERRWHAEACG